MSRSGSIDLQTLQRRCQSQLWSLQLPDQFELSALLASLAEHRGRPIILWPVSHRPGPCGLWAALPTRDYILYESATSPVHQAHIILHELAHLVWGHRSAFVVNIDVLQSLLPDIEPAVLETVLQRAHYDTLEEQEAEVLASLILRRVRLGEPVATPVSQQERRVLAGLAGSLEPPVEPVG